MIQINKTSRQILAVILVMILTVTMVFPRSELTAKADDQMYVSLWFSSSANGGEVERFTRGDTAY